MSSTPKKKQVVDYLWSWAQDRGEWAKELIQLLCKHEDQLTEEERKEIYGLLRDDESSEDQESTSDITIPKLSVDKHNVTLHSLSEVKGVNKLKGNQQLKFSPNLTVIYGDNASGKTGYARILKAIGQSYSGDVKIHGNVHSENVEEQQASIVYFVDHDEEIFRWDGTNSDESGLLQEMSIFDSESVEISLSNNRTLLVTPMGFHLFRLLAQELQAIEALHREFVNSIEVDVPWKEQLHEGTKAQVLIDSLSYRTDEANLKEQLKFESDDQLKLDELINEHKKLNKELLRKELREYRLWLSDIERVIDHIEDAKKVLTIEAWEKFTLDSKEYYKLSKRAKSSLEEIAKARGIEFYQSEEFQNFIQSAHEYLNTLDNKNYPEGEGDVCLYCRQDLADENAIELLKSYKVLLNDPTESQLKQISADIASFKKLLYDMDLGLQFTQPVYGVEDEGDIVVQPAILQSFIKQLAPFVLEVRNWNGKKPSEDALAVDFDKPFAKFEEDFSDVETWIEKKQKVLDTLSEQETALIKEINELKDQKFIFNKKVDILGLVRNLKMRNELQKLDSNFRTNSISSLNTQAREEIVADGYLEAFHKELNAIRRSDISVELEFNTSIGSSKLNHKVGSSRNLREVLSEGEQKVVALAEFLTEMNMSSSSCPIIFDDPVTSLDDKIIDEVANRFLKLAEEKQVVVFTHSILLLNSICTEHEIGPRKNLDFKYYYVQVDESRTGILLDRVAPHREKVGDRIKEINKIFGKPEDEKNLDTNRLAIEGYGHLRSAIEILVEKELLNGVVKRYRKNVALTNLVKVDGKIIDQAKEQLNEVFGHCCTYLDGHSNPDERVREPSLPELRVDFDKFKEVKKLIDENKNPSKLKGSNVEKKISD